MSPHTLSYSPHTPTPKRWSYSYLQTVHLSGRPEPSNGSNVLRRTRGGPTLCRRGREELRGCGKAHQGPRATRSELSARRRPVKAVEARLTNVRTDELDAASYAKVEDGKLQVRTETRFLKSSRRALSF